jgi:hypothetical protein
MAKSPLVPEALHSPVETAPEVVGVPEPVQFEHISPTPMQALGLDVEDARGSNLSIPPVVDDATNSLLKSGSTAQESVVRGDSKLQ